MTCTLRYIDGPPQSGKTFLCMAAVVRAHARGLKTLWLSGTTAQANLMRRAYAIPGTVWAWSERLTGETFSVIVVDMPHPMWTPGQLAELRARNERRTAGPSTLLVTRLTP